MSKLISLILNFLAKSGRIAAWTNKLLPIITAVCLVQAKNFAYLFPFLNKYFLGSEMES